MIPDWTIKEWLDAIAAFATLALAVFTGLLAKATFKLARDAKEASQRQIDAMQETTTAQIQAWQEQSMQQIGTQTWLEFQKQFDSKRMKSARVELAVRMPYKSEDYDALSDDLINLFESIGIAYKKGVLHRDLARCSFGYYGAFWWASLERMIKELRRGKGGDNGFYSEFESFAAEMAKAEVVNDISLKEFWEEERGLDC